MQKILWFIAAAFLLIGITSCNLDVCWIEVRNACLEGYMLAWITDREGLTVTRVVPIPPLKSHTFTVKANQSSGGLYYIFYGRSESNPHKREINVLYRTHYKIDICRD